MKVVVDTNVLISGVFFGGATARVLEAWRDRKIELVVYPEIFGQSLRFDVSTKTINVDIFRRSVDPLDTSPRSGSLDKTYGIAYVINGGTT